MCCIVHLLRARQATAAPPALISSPLLQTPGAAAAAAAATVGLGSRCRTWMWSPASGPARSGAEPGGCGPDGEEEEEEDEEEEKEERRYSNVLSSLLSFFFFYSLFFPLLMDTERSLKSSVCPRRLFKEHFRW